MEWPSAALVATRGEANDSVPINSGRRQINPNYGAVGKLSGHINSPAGNDVRDMSGKPFRLGLPAPTSCAYIEYGGCLARSRAQRSPNQVRCRV